ncbi:sulfatase [Neolewinella sp.]|uniref:sulfatase n=1 Tax=Neolewinella sp. TaxID=2993543 RepID=UPI003B515EB4
MRYLVHLLVLTLAASCGNTETAPTTENTPLQHPNFIIIVADDLGWNDLSSYGNAFTETPNLDRLARQGVRFTSAYAAAPLCSASRSSLMTGLNPVQTNITEHIHGNQPARPDQRLATPFIDQELQLHFTTFAEALREHGYATGFIGKWHLGGGGYAPQHQGFDVNIAGGYEGLPNTYFYPWFRPGSKPEIQDDAQEGDYLTDVLTDKAIDYVSAERDTSFVLYLAYYSPHVPIEGPEDLVEKYRQKRIASGQDTSALPNFHYAAMVESIDRNVGRLLATLDSLGLAETTAIVFTSDNGGLHVPSIPGFDKHTPPMKNDPLREGKGYTYEGGMRVPFIVRWPGTAAGVVTDQPVIGTDLFATLMDAVGDTTELAYSNSIIPALNGPQDYPERTMIWHNPHYNHQGHRPSSAIRRGDWKLIHFYETDTDELYDLANDLAERNDLATAHPERVSELKQALDGALERMNTQFPSPNPAYTGGE